VFFCPAPLVIETPLIRVTAVVLPLLKLTVAAELDVGAKIPLAEIPLTARLITVATLDTMVIAF
jgi:hypothetical protein